MLAIVLASISFGGGRTLHAQAPIKSSVEDKQPKVDSLGDPLPPYALARWGTARLQHIAGGEDVEFSPSGKALATWGFSDTVLWDVASGKELHSFVGGGAVFSDDDRTLATLEADGTIHTWDWTTGQEIHRFNSMPHTLAVLAVSPDGNRLIVHQQDVVEQNQNDVIVEFDAKTGKELKTIKLVQGPDDRPPQFIVAPRNGLYFAVQNRQRTVSVWETASGKKVYRIPMIKGFGLSDQNIAFSADGKTLVFTTEGRNFHVWDVPGNRYVKQLTLPAYSGGSVTLATDGKTLYANASTGQNRPLDVVICDLTEGGQIRTLKDKGCVGFFSKRAPLPLNKAYAAGPAPLAISAGNKYLATFALNGSVRVWDVVNDTDLHHFLGPREGVRMVGLSADDKTLLSCDATRKVRTFDLATGKELRVFDVPGRGEALVCADGIAIEMGQDRYAAEFDLVTGKERFRLTERSSFPHDISLGPDNEILKSHGVRDTRFWSISRGTEVRYLLPRLPPPILRGTNDSCILTLEGNRIRLWDPATGESIHDSTSKHTLSYPSQLSPDGRTLFLGGSFIEVASGLERSRLSSAIPTKSPDTRPPVRPRPAALGPWLFSPDGRWLILGSGLRIVVYDAASGKRAGELTGHRHALTCGAVSRDGSRLFTGSNDSTILAWDLAAITSKTPRKDTKLSASELSSLWNDLTSSDAPRSYQAMWRLADDREAAVRHIADRLKGLDLKRIARLIEDLDSDKFAVRERASQELEQLGAGAVPSLKRALEGKPSLEVRSRATKLLNKLAPQGGVGGITDDLLMHRVIEVLEHVGTPEAMGVLKEIAQGKGSRSVLLQAKLTLNRLARR
jgi:WD40 repeat protein